MKILVILHMKWDVWCHCELLLGHNNWGMMLCSCSVHCAIYVTSLLSHSCMKVTYNLLPHKFIRAYDHCTSFKQKNGTVECRAI